MTDRHPRHTTPRPRARIVRLLAAISLTMAACGGAESPEQAALDDALTTWSSTEHAHYRMTTQRSCECLPEYVQPIVVEVMDNAIVSAVYESSGDPVSADVQATLHTVDGMFGVIQDAIDEDAYRLVVSYDPTRGFPVDIFIDYDERVADEEFSLSVRDFELIP